MKSFLQFLKEQYPENANLYESVEDRRKRNAQLQERNGENEVESTSNEQQGR